jgi:hypothetical protein
MLVQTPAVTTSANKLFISTIVALRFVQSLLKRCDATLCEPELLTHKVAQPLQVGKCHHYCTSRSILHCVAALEHEPIAHTSRLHDCYITNKQVLKSGTLGDKISALTMRCKESPVHRLADLDKLVDMATKHDRRTAQVSIT